MSQEGHGVIKLRLQPLASDHRVHGVLQPQVPDHRVDGVLRIVAINQVRAQVPHANVPMLSRPQEAYRCMP